MGLTDTLKSGWEYLTNLQGPLDYLVDKGSEAVEWAGNQNISLSDFQNWTLDEYIGISTTLPGAEYVTKPIEYVAELMAFIVNIFDWIKAFFDVFAFFLLDPWFTIYVYEFMVMAIIMSKQSKGVLQGPEMVGELVKAQFFLFDVLFKVFMVIIDLMIKVGRFLRELVPFI